MKYYVTFGDQETVHNASTTYQACMKAFQQFLADNNYVDTLPLAFRTSQRGFEIHDTDEVIETNIIVRLQLLNNLYKENPCPNITSDLENLNE